MGRGVCPSSLAPNPKNPCLKPARLRLGSQELVGTWASCSLFSQCGLSQRKWEKQPAVLPPPLPRRSSAGDNEPFTHSQLQVLLVTLPICCHGCLAQERLGELIHGPLAGSSRSLRIAAAPLSAGSAQRPPEQERPCPALGQRLAGDARQALGACFLTRCKFFLFKALTFPRSPFPSPFVPQARRQPPRGPKRAWGSTPGFSLEPRQAGDFGKGSEAQLKPGTAPLFYFFFFLAKPVLVTPAIKLSGLTAADGSLRAGEQAELSLRSCQVSQLYISPLCQPPFSSLSPSPPRAIF